MSAYVDPARYPVMQGKHKGEQWCHLFADTIDELHQFARELGLKRTWYQTPETGSSWPHYDLSPGMRAKAVELGAIELTKLKDIVAAGHRLRDEWKEKQQNASRRNG